MAEDEEEEGGTRRARSHCRFLPPLIQRFIPDFLTYSVLLFLKRQCDRTLGTLWAADDADSAEEEESVEASGDEEVLLDDDD